MFTRTTAERVQTCRQSQLQALLVFVHKNKRQQNAAIFHISKCNNNTTTGRLFEIPDNLMRTALECNGHVVRLRVEEQRLAASLSSHRDTIGCPLGKQLRDSGLYTALHSSLFGLEQYNKLYHTDCVKFNSSTVSSA